MSKFMELGVQESGLAAMAYGGILRMKEWCATYYKEVVDCDHEESMRIHIARKLLEMSKKGEKAENQFCPKEGWRVLENDELLEMDDIVHYRNGTTKTIPVPHGRSVAYMLTPPTSVIRVTRKIKGESK